MGCDGEDDIHRRIGENQSEGSVNGVINHSGCQEKAIRTPRERNAVNGGRLFPLCGLGIKPSTQPRKTLKKFGKYGVEVFEIFFHS